MKFSIFLPSGFAQEFADIPSPVTAYQRLVEVAKFADYAGYETLFAPDHLTTIPPSHETVFEAWSLITGLARETSRVRLGHLVTANSYRNPALAAKIASTVDVISHGRLVFGIGAGWWEPDYPAVRIRVRHRNRAPAQTRRGNADHPGLVDAEGNHVRRQVLPGARRGQRAQRRSKTTYSADDRRRRRD